MSDLHDKRRIEKAVLERPVPFHFDFSHEKATSSSLSIQIERFSPGSVNYAIEIKK
jgi:hypothetical protein